MMQLTVTVVVVVALLASVAFASEPQVGRWRAWLDSPGGPMPFELELNKSEVGWSAFIVNGIERIGIPDVRWSGDELVIDITHYDSRIVASADSSGERLDGSWTKRRSPTKVATVPFHAERTDAARFEPLGRGEPAPFTGRWRVDFEHDDDPAVGGVRHRGRRSRVRDLSDSGGRLPIPVRACRW